MPEIPSTLTSAEVCKILRISRRTLSRLMEEGIIRHAKIRGSVRFLLGDVMWLFGEPELLDDTAALAGEAIQ